MSEKTDPRFVRSRQGILKAARELLLAHGPSAVTHSRIAETTGIGRATVYRHWPRTHELLAEAMATVPMPFFDVPRPPIRQWLKGELTALAKDLEQDDVRAVATTLANSALWDPAMDRRRAAYAGLLSERLVPALLHAEQSGELALTADADSIPALLIGPIYFRATIERARTDALLIDACINSIGYWNRDGTHGDPTSPESNGGGRRPDAAPHLPGAG